MLPFRQRCTRFDWQALHGCDVGALGAGGEAGATLERLVDTLVEGDILLEPPLSPANYGHLICLLQLAVQYVQQVRLWLARGVELLHQAATRAVALKAALLELCDKVAEGVEAALSQPGMQQACRSLAASEKRAEQLAASYTNATHALQAAARPRWHPLPPSRPIDWLAVHSLDIQQDLYVSQEGLSRLQQLLPMLTAGSLGGAGAPGAAGGDGLGPVAALTPPNYVQLVRLLQCGLDLGLYQAEQVNAEKEAARQEWAAADAEVQALLARWQHLQTRRDDLRRRQQQQPLPVSPMQPAPLPHAPAGRLSVQQSRGQVLCQPPPPIPGWCGHGVSTAHSDATEWAIPAEPQSPNAGCWAHINQDGCRAATSLGRCWVGGGAALPPPSHLFCPATCVSPVIDCSTVQQGSGWNPHWPAPAASPPPSRHYHPTWQQPLEEQCKAARASGGGPTLRSSPLDLRAMALRASLCSCGQEGGVPPRQQQQQQRELADAVESTLSKERLGGRELCRQLSELSRAVEQLGQPCERAGQQQPALAPPPLSLAPPRPVRSPSPSLHHHRSPPPPPEAATKVEVDVGGVRAEVRRQAEAQLRFQIEEIKRKAFQDVQRSLTPHQSRCVTPAFDD